jgi:hypothetical protein
MAKEKWSPSAKLTLAISKVEEQAGALNDWGTGEHLACVRYLVHECIGVDGKVDKAALKDEFTKESAFLGYASNAKKMLVEYGTLTATRSMASTSKKTKPG